MRLVREKEKEKKREKERKEIIPIGRIGHQETHSNTENARHFTLPSTSLHPHIKSIFSPYSLYEGRRESSSDRWRVCAACSCCTPSFS